MGPADVLGRRARAPGGGSWECCGCSAEGRGAQAMAREPVRSRSGGDEFVCVAAMVL